MPSLWSSDSCKRLYAHLLLSFYEERMYFLHDTQHGTVIHLFLDFSAKNGNEDVPIQEYFGFSHALHLMPAVFKIRFHCGKSPTLYSK